jgi:hypothetical protein
MGMSESAIKALTDPVNNLITNCGHSDCKSKCGNCFELEIDTTHMVNSIPTLLPREESRESNISNVTKIVERQDL